MKAITALGLLKRHGFAHSSLTLRELKRARVILAYRTWEEFIRGAMLGEYLVGKRDLTEAVSIPEVKLSIGGTLRYRVELKKE